LVGFVLCKLCKGIRWMSGHQGPMKDVGGCDMLGELSAEL